MYSIKKELNDIKYSPKNQNNDEQEAQNHKRREVSTHSIDSKPLQIEEIKEENNIENIKISE